MYFCEMYPTCVSSKLCEFIYLELLKGGPVKKTTLYVFNLSLNAAGRSSAASLTLSVVPVTLNVLMMERH